MESRHYASIWLSDRFGAAGRHLRPWARIALAPGVRGHLRRADDGFRPTGQNGHGSSNALGSGARRVFVQKQG